MFRIVKGGTDGVRGFELKVDRHTNIPTGFEALIKTEDIGNFRL